jgi:hypothetical protein
MDGSTHTMATQAQQWAASVQKQQISKVEVQCVQQMQDTLKL